jgi:hypothetical protein
MTATHKARLKLMVLIEEFGASDLDDLREAFEVNS